ncbi:TetR family transcriptional regulator [Serratia sp. MYb239]|uniref:TetR/AcrR family transcriptional regulator n=1 Tax=Serratia sp. MYb239 TaxID=2033438 RepID=UPI000CF5EC05|nr:TetR/AcrR family transcriptional regulator [Serratia sp. MYb239]AVJ19419.1 TetR family transcriptional regulator [Serratia sp. MYb239]
MTTADSRSARERIIDTAHRLFYQDGIRATGIDRIIKQAGVTKVTFYRHFPAKNDLILAFLRYRHERWIAWFRETLAREMANGGTLPQALPATLAQWFATADFRGCAFINTAVEMADSLPETLVQAREHKQDMMREIAAFLPDDRQGAREAHKLALLVDGAIVMAQRGEKGVEVLSLLRECVADSLKR